MNTENEYKWFMRAERPSLYSDLGNGEETRITWVYSTTHNYGYIDITQEDAELIEGAINVFDKTGKSPRELQEENDYLKDLIRRITPTIEEGTPFDLYEEAQNASK